MGSSSTSKRKRPSTGPRIARSIPSPRSLERLSRGELVSLSRNLMRERSRKSRRLAKQPLVETDDVTADVSSALAFQGESPSQVAGRQIGVHSQRARGDVRGGRWESALRRATGIVEGFAAGYDPGWDEAGSLTWDLHEALGTVDASLGHVPVGRDRKEALDALLEIWWADLGHGGVGLADDVPGILRKRATREERIHLANQIQEGLPDAKPGFEKEHAAKLVLELDGGRFKDETYLEFCLAHGLHRERVARLIARKRVPEAVHVASTDLPRYRLTEAADRLVKDGHQDLAVALVESGLKDPESRAFHGPWKEWLQKRAEERHDLPQATRLAWEQFAEAPTMATYESFRRVSRRARMWGRDEGTVLSLLRRPDLGQLLTAVHLKESRVSEALRTFDRWAKDHPRGWESHELQRQLARAAEKDNPEAARDLYLGLAEEFVSRKTRGWYASAAPLVKAAWTLAKRIEGESGAQHVLASFRERYAGYTALWDELRKAGLG